MIQLDTSKIIGVSDAIAYQKLWRTLSCEFLGTFLLVIIGIGSCARNSNDGPADVIQIAFTFGLTVAAIVQGIGHISGGHLNPAVTIGFLIVGQISLLKSILYILVQCLGAMAASALLKVIIPEEMGRQDLGVSNFATPLNAGQAFLVEALITALLVFVVKTVADTRHRNLYGMGPLFIGLAVTVGHLNAIKLSGASMNPARSYGPAVIHNTWNNHWVYWAGPIIGSIVMSILHKIIFDIGHI